MQQRGSQSRRMRSGPPDRVRRPIQTPESGGAAPRPPRSDNLRIWQVLAIVAIIAATAGWTTSIMLALRPSDSAQAYPSDDLGASDSTGGAGDSLAPVDLSHDFPDLEAILPAAVNGTTLQKESWTGDAILADDGWSNSVTAFLKTKNLGPSGLEAGQISDPDQNLDLVVRVFRVKGVAPSDLLQAMISGWKVDYPDLKTSQTTVGDKTVTKGDFGQEGVDSWWYVRGDVVYDVETGDPAIAAAALAAIPAPGTTAAPAPSGSGAAGSSAPSAAPSRSPAPSGSPAPSPQG